MRSRLHHPLVWAGIGAFLACPLIGQNSLYTTAARRDIESDVLGRSTSAVTAVVSTPVEEGVRYKIDRIEVLRGAPNFLIAVPASGVTPGVLTIVANPQVVRSLRRDIQAVAGVIVRTVDQTPPRESETLVYLTIRAAPPPRIDAVVNSASLEPLVSPGSIVSIFGDHLGPLELGKGYGPDGAYPTSIGDLTVTIDGAQVPILFVSPTQIDVVSPFELTGRTSASVVVSRLGETTPGFLVAVAETAPGIFTGSRHTAGQGGILNHPGAVPNTKVTPAAPGSLVTLFATGAGTWAGTDRFVRALGRDIFWVRLYPQQPFCISGSFCVRPVSVTIGGLPAPVWYSGVAPFQPAGVFQVNVQVPRDLTPGTHPVILQIGDADNARQGVTIEVR